MTNMPTNPTKNELIEKYWWEFLQYLKNSPELPEEDFTRLIREIGMENMFWTYFMQKKMRASDASQTTR